MTPVASAHDSRQRRKFLVALAVLFFFAPLAVSFYMYYGRGGAGDRRKQRESRRS